ncbi:MAG: ketopantoate reductase family protein [Candidatus Omnitrophica bacterium]|nr:ketopantoate reductase family protein [Candidatus Omnitrophota bacterium]
MRVAILGCGAIGGAFLGYLSGRSEVIGIVKEYQKEPLTREGLKIEGVRGTHNVKVNVQTVLTEPVDVAVIATKIADLEAVLKENGPYLKDSFILTTQNGIAADYIVENYSHASRIITGIVMFGATFYPPDRVVHNFEGSLVVGSLFKNPRWQFDQIERILSPVTRVVNEKNIRGAKYLKIFVNLNNCIPAVLGVSLQDAFSNLEIAECAIYVNREAYSVIEDAGIELVSLPGYPKERIQGLVTMPPKEAAVLFSKVMASLSEEPLYGSILQSIRRGKPSEIDYINGEIVGLAEKSMSQAPLNKKMVELVHRVEKTNTFLSVEEFMKELTKVEEKSYG